MDGNPKVSIVIPFYNCPYVDQAIESALNQSYPNIQVIVVDDGSTMYSEKVNPYLNKIRYIKKGNGGTASALNMGIKNATGEYFTWLSSDDLYDRFKVEKQLTFMKESQADFCYGNYHLIDTDNKIISEPAGISMPTRIKFLEIMRKGCIINGCTVMLKVKIFEEVGVFDTSLPYTHDYDLWLRILPNYHFYYFQEPLVMYRVHSEMGSKKYEQVIPREILMVQKKHDKKLEELIAKELLK
ncbi:Glycosyltransferase involved in cell wall bisynthesis [Peribacillus simplex]|uniref:Glycosyltransferase involved in cell wall bisynthesis n=1 Tax=Peribacillus simplex TaxID=1478 RepID=A0A9X8R548_9BACI|nr:glycosyltransferase [Peribacillus simplex]SIQ42491.1 Glycosyltransferase involved in cell wall bisynthesis [Peribacillus simplex]